MEWIWLLNSIMAASVIWETLHPGQFMRSMSLSLSVTIIALEDIVNEMYSGSSCCWWSCKWSDGWPTSRSLQSSSPTCLISGCQLFNKGVYWQWYQWPCHHWQLSQRMLSEMTTQGVHANVFPFLHHEIGCHHCDGRGALPPRLAKRQGHIRY